MSCHILIWHMWRLWQYEWKTEWSNSLDFIYIALTILITWNDLTMWMPLTYIRERIYFLFKLLFLSIIWEFEYTSSLPYPSSHFISLFPAQIHGFFLFLVSLIDHWLEFVLYIYFWVLGHLLIDILGITYWRKLSLLQKPARVHNSTVSSPIPWFQMYCWQADLNQACRPL